MSIEAAAHGADAILLIAAILDVQQMRGFRELAARYGMAALVEVHDDYELDAALDSGADIVGVNNRNLHTFEVTLDTSLRLAEKMPAAVVKIAESGIHSRADVRAAPGRRVPCVSGRRAPDEIRGPRRGAAGIAVMMVKVCGITRREDALVAAEAGASAIGFIFYPQEPALYRAGACRGAGRGLDLWKVGIFVDESPAAIEAVMRAAHLDVAQIYGAERPAGDARLESRPRGGVVDGWAGEAPRRCFWMARRTVYRSTGNWPAARRRRSSSREGWTRPTSPRPFDALSLGASTPARNWSPRRA